MMAKILVVDDETDLEVLIKQKFRKKIREKEYEFFFAINGKDALEKLIEQPDVDIVLSDINMPEMDGLTLLTKLNELSPLIKSQTSHRTPQTFQRTAQSIKPVFLNKLSTFQSMYFQEYSIMY